MTLKLDKRGSFSLITEHGIQKLSFKQAQKRFGQALITKLRNWLNTTKIDVVTVEV